MGIILIGFFVIIASSCNKYLDTKQDKKLVVPKSISDLQALLDNGNMNRATTPSYGETSSDDYFLKPSGYNATREANQKYYTWRNYFFGAGNDWSTSYKPIYISNLVLDILKDIDKNENNTEAWDNIKGSALFFRSYYFTCLLWNFSKAYEPTTSSTDLGIALRLTSNFNIKSTRASIEICYGQVIQDVKRSIQLLPEYPVNVMRPSKEAAYALLARCYLSMRVYDRALVYADSALQLNSHLMNYNGDDDIPLGLTTNSPFAKFNKEIIFYSEMNLYYGGLFRSANGRIDTSLVSSYSSSDLRLNAFYKSNIDGYVQFKGTYGLNSYYFSGLATDEMFLIRAECYIRAGNIDKGLKDLNSLLEMRTQSHSFSPITADSREDALRIVLLERRKELVMRGLRWMDLKRLNREGANITLKRVEDDGVYILEPNANFYALPIPDDIIQLTGMPQNQL